MTCISENMTYASENIMTDASENMTCISENILTYASVNMTYASENIDLRIRKYNAEFSVNCLFVSFLQRG